VSRFEGIPTTVLEREELEAGVRVIDLFVRVGLCKTKSEARRLVRQGGCYVNNGRVSSELAVIYKDGDGTYLRERVCPGR